MQERDRAREREKANTAQLRTAKGKSNEIEYENLHSYCMGILKHIYAIYTIYITVFANGNCKHKQCINNGNKS